MNIYLQRGEDHYRSKLTEEAVKDIKRIGKLRKELREQMKQLSNQSLADKYGVSKKAVEKVLYNGTWTHIN